MSTLKVSSIRDLSGSGGLNLSSGSITVNGTLTVSNIVINGTIGGSSSQVIPSISGQSGKYLSTNGTSMSWATVQTGGGPKSISVYNSNSTWNKPTGIKRIWVMCTAGGGGGSGYGESGAAGAHTEQIVNVQNINSISVTVGGAGGGTNYSQRGGNGGTSSFGNYCSSGGGQGANRRQQHDGSTGGNPSQGAVRIYGGSSQGHRNPPGLGHGGTSFWGGSSPTSHRQQQWAQRHRGHAAYGAGGSSARNRERGGDGRQGIVVVYEFD
jgi:hypothetical protein